MPRFKEPISNRDQVWLFPPSLDELVCEESDVRLLDEAMNQMDWSALESSYSETGRPAYDPRILAKALVYSYSKGIRSSRRIEDLICNDVRLMWLCECERPNFHTIARFRKEKFNELGELFAQSVRLCANAGLVLLKSVSVDGSKIRADVSVSSLYSADRLSKEREYIEGILREAEEVDAEEDRLYGESNGREIPEDMKDPVLRRGKLAELARRMREEGQRTISKTDPECRMMKCSDGVRPCYNVQAAVDTSSQVIVACDVTNAQRDHEQLAGMVERVKENTGSPPEVVLADAGYSSESTLVELSEMGQDALIPPSGERSGSESTSSAFAGDKFVFEKERDVLICPAGRELRFRTQHRKGSGTYRCYAASGCRGCEFYAECVPSGIGNRRIARSVVADLRESMRERLRSPEGRALFAARKATVEPVFGQIKHNRGFRRFVLRGVRGAAAEVYLVATAHNIMKWATAHMPDAPTCLSSETHIAWACG